MNPQTLLLSLCLLGIAQPWMESFPVDVKELTTIGENPYFILKPGYQLTLEGKDSGKTVQLVVTVLQDTVNIGGVETRIVEERETHEGVLVEVSRNFFAIHPRTRDVYYFGEDVDMYKNGKLDGHEGTWRHGSKGARFGLFMPGTPTVGMRFYQELAPKVAMDRAEVVSIADKLTTPAGMFDKCLKTKETTPLETFAREYKVYAPGIGIVQDGPLKLVSHKYVQNTSPVFRAETRLVVLHATVKNSHGAIVTNLDQRAFTVYENGKVQPITLFRRQDVPVSIGLLIDNSGSMKTLRATVEAAALAFVRASNPLDDVFVVNFADKARLDVPMTSDMRVLEAGITRVDSIGGTAMRDAVMMAERYLRERATRDRKVLLVITDGNDNASATSIDELRKTAEQSETAVFAVGLFRDDRSSDARRGRDELDRLTEVTGGRSHYPPSIDRVESVVLEIAREIRNEYTIAYAPLNRALDGKYRTIQVKVNGPDRVSVRTRPGYWAS